MANPARMLVEVSSVAAAPGDFKAHVAGDTVFLPGDLVTALRQQGIRSLEEIVAYAKTFPTAVALAMGWSLPDAISATARLEDQLHSGRPKQPERTRPEPAYGALSPGDLPPAKTGNIAPLRR